MLGQDEDEDEGRVVVEFLIGFPCFMHARTCIPHAVVPNMYTISSLACTAA